MYHMTLVNSQICPESISDDRDGHPCREKLQTQNIKLNSLVNPRRLYH